MMQIDLLIAASALLGLVILAGTVLTGWHSWLAEIWPEHSTFGRAS